MNYFFTLAADIGEEIYTFSGPGGFYTLDELHRILDVYKALPESEKVRRKYGDLARLETKVLCAALSAARYKELQHKS